ncbi:rod shape-determining protein MreC [Nostoc sp.]|uniref:rod shape-determining protein MreC n=1 Tax=Nostoc sp. TaxID=1180 RepID=UPI002FF55B4D
MVTIRRWWDRKGLQIGLLALVVGSAWILRQTQGELVLETYQAITRPLEMLQSGPTPEERLRDARILELQTRIVDLESQKTKLQNLLGYAEKEPLASRPIPARVVGRSADQWWQQVTLNRGANVGIGEGFIVKADGGLVGLVESVTPNTSRVLLISDLNSQVGVSVSRTSAKGVLRGDSSAEAVLEFYEKVPNVKVGDLVSTSTYSQKFPSGLAVGRIKSLDLKKLPASVAKIELFPPIRSLDWVAVYPKPENQESENQVPQKSK